MDDYSPNAIQYGVKLKNDGAHRLHRRLLLLAYFVFSVGYILLLTIPVQLYPALAGLPFLLLLLYRITWWRLDYDFDYTLAHGELVAERVYSAKRRREVARVKLTEVSAAAPYDKTSPPRGKRIDCRGSVKATNSYYLLYRREGKPAVFLFEANERIVKTIAKYCPDTVIPEGLPR